MDTTKTYEIEALGETYTFTATEDANYPGMHNYVIWVEGGKIEIGKGYSDGDAARRAMMNRTRYLGKKDIAASGATRTATVIA